MNELNSKGAPVSAQELEHITTILQSLTNDLVLTKTTPTFDASPYLTQSAPLFAALHAINRSTLRFTTKDLKTKTQDARLKMDGAHLRLQVSLPFSRRTTLQGRQGRDINFAGLRRTSCLNEITWRGKFESAKNSNQSIKTSHSSLLTTSLNSRHYPLHPLAYQYRYQKILMNLCWCG